MEPPKSISYEVFELFNRIIDQSNRINRVLRSLEDKNRRHEEVIFQFETFSSNLKNQLSSYVENSHFQIEKSLNLYKMEHERVVNFFNENEKTKELYHEAQKLHHELVNFKLSYESLTSQFAEAYQKFQTLLENLTEKANRHIEKTSQELKDKIDSEIQKKVERDLKNIEINILLKNKLLEGKVSDLNNSVNTLYSIFQLPEFQALFNDRASNDSTPEETVDLAPWQEAKKLDKLGQKQQNLTSEIELRLEQITEAFKDFETRLNKDKKEINKIYDSLLEFNKDDYKKVSSKVHDLYFEIEKLERDLAKSRTQTIIAIVISASAVVIAVSVSLLN